MKFQVTTGELGNSNWRKNHLEIRGHRLQVILYAESSVHIENMGGFNLSICKCTVDLRDRPECDLLVH